MGVYWKERGRGEHWAVCLNNGVAEAKEKVPGVDLGFVQAKEGGPSCPWSFHLRSESVGAERFGLISRPIKLLSSFRHVFRMSSRRTSARKPGKRARKGGGGSVDEDYFGGYSGIGIHQDMLKDEVRTETYRDAILEMSDFIKGKAVLDVGCGTGILSLFAKQAGARVVYAVDASDMAKYAERIAKANGAEGVIKVIKGKMEEVDLPEGVDVIISEWMGYFLVYESMLDSVFFARDKWLKPGGKILPDRATLYISAFTWPGYIKQNLGFWQNVYNFDFSPLLPMAAKTHLNEPVIDQLRPEQELSERREILGIDMYTAKTSDFLEWKADFKLPVVRSGISHGVMAYFEVTFPLPPLKRSKLLEARRKGDFGTEGKSGKKRGRDIQEIVLTTGPEGEQTHWGQCMFFFNDFDMVRQDDCIKGTISVSRTSSNPRLLDISLTWATDVISPALKTSANNGVVNWRKKAFKLE
ncbi:hypothetical protein AAMO2058_000134900 [Amorphochlora amoebiformis]